MTPVSPVDIADPVLPPMLARMPEPGPVCRWAVTGGYCGKEAATEVVCLPSHLLDRTVDELMAMHAETMCDRHLDMQIRAYKAYGGSGSVIITRRVGR